jgi:shikimate kinase
MTVYLLGFMGSGKSTFGKRLASGAGWGFIDLDSLIEDAEGKSIEEIFRVSGEDYFRDVEAAALRSISMDQNVVIACGGGTPCYRDNMDYMNRSGLTVYIRLDARSLANRLLNAKKTRPLLKDMDDRQLEEYITAKLAEREEYYNRSRILIDGLRTDPGKLMEIISTYHSDNQRNSS